MGIPNTFDLLPLSHQKPFFERGEQVLCWPLEDMVFHDIPCLVGILSNQI